MQGSHYTATYETASAMTHLPVLYFDKMLLKNEKGRILEIPKFYISKNITDPHPISASVYHIQHTVLIISPTQPLNTCEIKPKLCKVRDNSNATSWANKKQSFSFTRSCWKIVRRSH